MYNSRMFVQLTHVCTTHAFIYNSRMYVQLTHLCTTLVEPPRRRFFIWKIRVNSSIQDQRQVVQVFFGVESVVRGNADSLLNRDATTSTTGTLNDLITDLNMVNNNMYTSRLYVHNVLSLVL